MRLDKYLKVSRLIKRRTLAKEVCDQGRVQMNGRIARASSPVTIGDEITLQFGQRSLTIRVEGLTESIRKEKASELFTVINEEIRKSENEY